MKTKTPILILSPLWILAAGPPKEVFAQAAKDTAPVASAAPIGKIYELGVGITPPKYLRQDALEQACDPFGSGKARDGSVMLSFVVTEAGEVFQVKVQKTPSIEMATCAVQAMQRTRFAPAWKGGKPIAVHMFLEFSFGTK